jgi:hypothetical protein
MSKVCVISEGISMPFDEGRKNFVRNLIGQICQSYESLIISTRDCVIEDGYVKGLSMNKTFLSYSLFKEIHCFNPDITIYVPESSAGLFSFIRTRILKWYAPEKKVVIISMQPRKYTLLSRILIPYLCPDLVFVQSLKVLKQLEGLGWSAEFLPGGVDLDRFRPEVDAKKMAYY